MWAKVTWRATGKARVSTYSTPNSLYTSLFTFPPPCLPKFKLFPKEYEDKPEPCPWQQHSTHTSPGRWWGPRLLCPHPSPSGLLGVGSGRQISRKTYPDTAQSVLSPKSMFLWVQKAPSISRIAEPRSTLATHSFPSQPG